VKVVDQSADN